MRLKATMPTDLLSELKSKYEKNSAWAERLALLILVGLAAEIVGVWILGKSLLEGGITIVANLLIILGVWGELRFERRAREAGDGIVAEANVRALEAQVELAKFKAPRSLNAEQRARIVVELAPFAGTRFVGYVAFSSEPLAVLGQIVECLNLAKWQVETLPPPIPHLIAPGLPPVGLAISFGLRVGFDKDRDPGLEKAATALAYALNSEGIETTVSTAKREEPGSNIFVQVGEKVR
jgi:hypothetical protein